MEKDEKRLTEHFRMDEFVYSAMAVELGLNNALPSEVIPAIRNLTVRLLEPLRIYYVYHEWLSKRRVKPISGRCP